jgi:hypothetical protein
MRRWHAAYNVLNIFPSLLFAMLNIDYLYGIFFALLIKPYSNAKMPMNHSA